MCAVCRGSRRCTWAHFHPTLRKNPHTLQTHQPQHLIARLQSGPDSVKKWGHVLYFFIEVFNNSFSQVLIVSALCLDTPPNPPHTHTYSPPFPTPLLPRLLPSTRLLKVDIYSFGGKMLPLGALKKKKISKSQTPHSEIDFPLVCSRRDTYSSITFPLLKSVSFRLSLSLSVRQIHITPA